MSRGTTRGAVAGLLLAGLLPAVVSSVEAGIIRVPIGLPLLARMDVSGVQTILVVNLLANDHPDIALSEEMVKQLRRLLEKGTPYRILKITAPHLPEQNLADLMKNEEYWREMGRRYGADLILSGQIDFVATDRSGFVQEDYISPVTGQRTRRTRYAERESFDLNLGLTFFWGANGRLAYEDRYTEQAMFEGQGADHLGVLHALLTRLEPDILGILTAQFRTEYRFLFDD